MQMGSSGRGRLDNGTHELRAHSLRLSPERQSEASAHENSSSSLTHMVMHPHHLSLPCLTLRLHLYTSWSLNGHTQGSLVPPPSEELWGEMCCPCTRSPTLVRSI